MTTDPDDPWDVIADGLDDLERIIDEQEDRLPEGVQRETIRRLRTAIGEARAAADDIEDERAQKEGTDVPTMITGLWAHRWKFRASLFEQRRDIRFSTRVETVGADGKTQVTTFTSHLDDKEYAYNSPIADKITTKGSDWRVADSVVTKAGKVVQTTHSVVSQDGKTLTMTTTYGGDTKTDIRLAARAFSTPIICPLITLSM